ncbi:MAG: TatD family hydrolase [Syntrophothermus sp.]
MQTKGLPVSGDYINIHTHNLSGTEGEFSLHNIFAQEFLQVRMESSRIYSVGLHPWHIKDSWNEGLAKIIRDASVREEIAALGEAGLDRAIETPLDVQTEVLIPQLKIAEKAGKPVLIHCVRAYSEIIGIRNKYRLKVPWIFHSFTANLQIAGQLISHGCYLSFGKFLLAEKSPVPELFRHINDDYIFLENDDANLNIREIYRRACELKGYGEEKMKMIIYNNFKRCFDDRRI